MNEMPETAQDRIARLLDQTEAAKRDVEALTEPEAVSKALAPVASEVPAETQRRQMAEVRARAMRQQQEIARLEQEMRAEMEAQISQMRAVMAPLKKQIAQMEEGIWTANLYLGAGEEIVTILDGEPAPADTPLTLRQQVLSMDEETAAHADAGGIDARNLDVFDTWIADPEHLAQVLPEPKGVVVLVPRRRGRDYQDPWVDERLNKENRWSYWLIRNGDRLYRMRTDYVVGKHLIPRVDEFTALFTRRKSGRHGESEQIVPGTRAWDKAVEAQGARERHYMRMALILQGLIDRTTVFHPLPAAGINLLSGQTFGDGTAVLVRDAEHALADGRDEFYDWLKRLNGELRVGMRIMGVFSTAKFKDAGDEYSERNHYSPNGRITPRASSSYEADKPRDASLYRLESKRTVSGVQGLAFKFDRTREREYRDEWGRIEYRAPKTKATCVILPGDRFILPFDLVTVEEMRYYLGSRVNRHAYEDMFPLLHVAIEAKQAEQAAEQPFRDLLAAELVKADPALAAATSGDPDLVAAHAALDPLVDWWKVGNKHHRALHGEPAAEKAAINAIVAEHVASATSATTQTGDAAAEDAMVDRLRTLDPSIFVIARKRDGGYLAFAPQPRRYTNPAATRQDLWAREHTTTKTGKVIKTRDWLIVGSRAEGLRVLFRDEEVWATWDRFTVPSEDLTDPEIDEVIAALMPRVVDEVRTGWVNHAWHKVTGPIEVLPLGIAHKRTDKQFQVWMTETTDPAALTEAPRADTGSHRGPDLTFHEHYVTVSWTKTPKDGLVLADRADWTLREHKGGSYSGGGDETRPWRYVWNGAEQGPGEVIAYAQGQAHAADRTRRIAEHKDAHAVLVKPTETSLKVLRRGIRDLLEQRAYAAFLAEYLDPALWDGHVKTLRRGYSSDPFEPNFAAGRYYRGVPETLCRALDLLTDAGVAHDGLSVRTAVERAGLDVERVAAEFDEKANGEPIPGHEFLDLSLSAEPEGTPPETPNVDEDEDPGYSFDASGLRLTDAGTVVVSVVVENVTDTAPLDESTNLPVPRDPDETR